MDVSVIIVNYNTLNMTRECIDSIYQNTNGISFEVILVDNASTDGSKDYFDKDTRIKYIYSSENLGFGRANNLGMKQGKGDYFFLLNSDTLLVNNAIKKFHDFAKKKGTTAFYGCWLKNRNGEYTHSKGDIPTISSLLWELCKSYIPGRYQGDKAVHYSDIDFYKVGYVTGADIFFSRSIYNRTGGFDARFFMYYEETDWQRTAAKQGIYSYIIHGPQIIHYEGASQDNKHLGMNVAKFKRRMQSQYYYIKKEYNIQQYYFYRICNTILYIPKLLFGRSKSLEAIKILFI